MSGDNTKKKEFGEVIEGDIQGLMKRETLQEVRKSSFTATELVKMTIIKANLIFAFKDSETLNEHEKARIGASAIGIKIKQANVVHILLNSEQKVYKDHLRCSDCYEYCVIRW